jgi:hypothetical protein
MLTYIYKLKCKEQGYNKIYIGSTKNINSRKICHNERCNNEKNKRYNNLVYNYIRESGGIKNWEYEILEEYEAIDNTDRRIKEQKYINSYDSSVLLNQYRAYRSEKEKIQYEKDYRLSITNTRIECNICNSDFSIREQKRHKNTQKHKLNLLKKINELQKELDNN